MRHEVILNRTDGGKAQIVVKAWMDFISGIKYDVQVGYCLSKKRKFIWVNCDDDYSYRRLDKKGRDAYELNKQLEYVTKEEIYAAKIALWEKLKPTE